MLRTLLAMSTAGSPKKKNGASSEKSTGSVQVAAPDLMFPSLLREYDQTILSVTRGNLDGCADLKKTVEELFQPLERQGVGQVVGSISNLDDWTKEMRGQRAALRKFRQDLEKQKTQLQNAHKVIKEALVVKENGIGTMETKSRGGQQQKKPEVLEARIGSFIGPVDDLLLQNNNSAEMDIFMKMFQENNAERCPSYYREYSALIREIKDVSELSLQLEEQLTQPLDKSTIVGSSDEMDDKLDVFMEQRKVVKAIRDETRTTIKGLISCVEKVKENMKGMFKSVKVEEPQTKKRRGEEEKEADVGIETSGGSSLVKLRGEISLKNTGKEVLHVCVNLIHEEAILRPTFNPHFKNVVQMREAQPGESLKVTISHNRYPPWQESFEPQPVTGLHIAEFAFAHGKHDDTTEWKYLWVPYKVSEF